MTSSSCTKAVEPMGALEKCIAPIHFCSISALAGNNHPSSPCCISSLRFSVQGGQAAHGCCSPRTTHTATPVGDHQIRKSHMLHTSTTLYFGPVVLYTCFCGLSQLSRRFCERAAWHCCSAAAAERYSASMAASTSAAETALHLAAGSIGGASGIIAGQPFDT